MSEKRVRITANISYDGEYHQYAIFNGLRLMVQFDGMHHPNFLSNLGTEVDGDYIFHHESGKARIDVIADEAALLLIRDGANFRLYDGPQHLRAHGTVISLEFEPTTPLSETA